MERLLAASLVSFGLLMCAAGPGAGVAGLLGGALLAAEVLRRRPSTRLALLGIAAIGASGMLAEGERNLVLGLLNTAALGFSLLRGRAATIALAQALLATYVLAFGGVELVRGGPVPWWHMLLSFVSVNAVSAIGYELAASRRAALEQRREMEAGLEQQLLFARDLGQVYGEARALRQAIFDVRAGGRADSLPLQRLVHEARRVTGAEAVVLLAPSGGDLSVWETAHGDGTPSSDLQLRIAAGPETILAQVERHATPLWVGDAGDDPAAAALVPGERRPRALGLLPIALRDQVQWILLLIWWDGAREFTPPDRDLVEALAEQAGLALELAEARAELAARARGAEALHRVGAHVAGSRDIREIADHAVTALCELHHADAGGFYLVTATGSVDVLVAQGLPARGLEHLYIESAGDHRGSPSESGRSQVVFADRHAHRAGLQALLAYYSIDSLIVVPAISAGRPVGGLILGHRGSHRYRPHEIELLETFAEQLAGAIELAQAYAAVAELDRQREQFLSLVSHELRQPVAAIATVAEGLSAIPSLSPTQRRALDGLRTQARSLTLLAEDVLVVARLESGSFAMHPRPVDLGTLVAGLARECAEPERVQVQLAAEPMIAVADPERFGQALDNVLRNALKYSPRGAPVVVTLRGEGAAVRIDVRDEGVGLAADEVEQLFQKYGRVRNPRTARIEGVGLGLYLTRLIVEAHGGQIAATSPGPGQGSTFTITLPRGCPLHTGAAGADPPPTPSDLGKAG